MARAIPAGGTQGALRSPQRQARRGGPEADPTSTSDNGGAPAATSRRDWVTWFAIGLIAVGILIRLVPYLGGYSLWLDEQFVVLNILTRSYGDLLGGLEWRQTAPVGFLWGERLATSLFGPSELSLRLLPFLAGVSCVPLMWVVGRRFLPRPWALLAVAVVAFAPAHLFFTNAAKPYAMDTAATLLLLLATLRLLEQPADHPRRLWLLAGGIIAPVFSLPAMLVLAGAWVALAANREWRRSPGSWGWLAAYAMAWGTAAGLLYVLVYQPAARVAGMADEGWESAFISLSSVRGIKHTVRLLARQVFDLTIGDGEGTYFMLGLIPLALAGIGCISLARRPGGLSRAALAGIPGILLLVAAAARQYPISSRLALFVLPCLALLVPAGIAALTGWLPRPARVAAGWLAAGLLVLPPAVYAAPRVTEPTHYAPNNEDPRTLIRHFQAHHRPGDVIYITSVMIPAWLFYTTDWAAPDTARYAWVRDQIRYGGPYWLNAGGRGRQVAEEEGWELRREYLTWRELYGIPSGMKTTHGPLSQRIGDPGWAANERDRIANASGGEFWLLAIQQPAPAFKELTTALAAGGWQVVEQQGYHRVWLRHYSRNGVPSPGNP